MQQHEIDMTAEDLAIKYEDSNGNGAHPDFTLKQYHESGVTEDYWHWVVASIQKQGQTGIPKRAVIHSIDELVARMILWHKGGIALAEHMMSIPEGTEAEYPDHKGRPVSIKLTGKMLQAFKFGVMTGMDAFLKFPIAYEEETKEAANEPTTDTPGE